MCALGLQKEVSDFEELFKAFESLLKVREKFYLPDDHLATALCEVYATAGAYQILTCIGSAGGFDAVLMHEENADDFEACASLPTYEIARRAGQELLDGAASGDKIAVFRALKAMGVFALCPTPEHLFPRLEIVTKHIIGCAQQVFLVELSRLAVKVGDYVRASKYIQQSRAFDPSSWELYNICVVEGLIALNDGRVDEAVHCLPRSISACLAYENARAQCCIRAPNLELVEKLLERGERYEVLKHLLDCKKVWVILQAQIDSWIQAINSGERPDFLATGNLRVPEKPAHRLRMQWMNACALALGPVSSEKRRIPPRSPAEILEASERWRAENEPRLNAFIVKKLEYLEKDLAVPPNQSPSNPGQPGKPE